jgi:hypothetical protein
MIGEDYGRNYVIASESLPLRKWVFRAYVIVRRRRVGGADKENRTFSVLDRTAAQVQFHTVFAVSTSRRPLIVSSVAAPVHGRHVLPGGLHGK